MPDDGVLMMTAAGIFAGSRRPGAAGPAAPARWDGLALPAVLTMVVGTTPGPTLDVTAEFEQRADAVAWEKEWPARKRALLGNAAVLLTGVGAILARVELRREDDIVFIRTTASHEELMRLLNTIVALLAFQ